MHCFNGRCPPQAGKVRPGAAGEEEASGWHQGSYLQGYEASLTLTHSVKHALLLVQPVWRYRRIQYKQHSCTAESDTFGNQAQNVVCLALFCDLVIQLSISDREKSK